MRKILALALAALLFVGSISAQQCGDACNDASDCANAGTCRLCLDGTCQHRCAADETNPFKAAACGDACNDASDCANAGTCRLCLDGTCQHRCAADQPTEKTNFLAAACGDVSCSGSIAIRIFYPSRTSRASNLAQSVSRIE